MSTCDNLDVGCWLGWGFDELGLWIVNAYGWFMEGIASLISYIPVPDFLLNMGSYTLPGNIAYYAQALEFEAGFAIIIGAYTARFILRRLPVIG